MYTWINGSGHNVSHQSISQNTPAQQHGGARHPQSQGSPSIPTYHGYGTNLSHTMNGSLNVAVP
jgi:hypothetical protein